jgi:hypothetical protein
MQADGPNKFRKDSVETIEPIADMHLEKVSQSVNLLTDWLDLSKPRHPPAPLIALKEHQRHFGS